MAPRVPWSAMKGRVPMNGRPATGAVLARNYNWRSADDDAGMQFGPAAGCNKSLLKMSPICTNLRSARPATLAQRSGETLK